MDPAFDGWWQVYFDDAFLSLYRPLLDEETTRAEVGALLELLGLPVGARLLDVGCGWGRHAVDLAGAGLAVIGLDLSATLLAEARRRADAAGVQVEWRQGDMRELAWSGTFDAAVSLFSSLGYFGSDAEDARVLDGVRRALRPGGTFVIETMHRDQVARTFAARDWWPGADDAPVWVEREFDAVAGIVRERLRWLDTAGAAHEKPHAVRVRTATEWDVLLRAAGLLPVEWLGGWEMDAFSHESERLIVVARRER